MKKESCKIKGLICFALETSFCGILTFAAVSIILHVKTIFDENALTLTFSTEWHRNSTFIFSLTTYSFFTVLVKSCGILIRSLVWKRNTSS